MARFDAVDRQGGFEHIVGLDGRSHAGVRRDPDGLDDRRQLGELRNRLVGKVVLGRLDGIAAEVLDRLGERLDVGFLVIADLLDPLVSRVTRSRIGEGLRDGRALDVPFVVFVERVVVVRRLEVFEPQCEVERFDVRDRLRAVVAVAFLVLVSVLRFRLPGVGRADVAGYGRSGPGREQCPRSTGTRDAMEESTAWPRPE